MTAAEYTGAAAYLRAVAALQLVFAGLATAGALAVDGTDSLAPGAILGGFFFLVMLAAQAPSLRGVLRDVAPIETPVLVPASRVLRREATSPPLWLASLAIVAFAPELCLMIGGGGAAHLLFALAVERWEAKHGKRLVRVAERRWRRRGDFDVRDYGVV